MKGGNFMSNMSATKVSGLMLAVGAILTIFASLFRPGSYLIEPSFASDAGLVAVVRVLANNANLTHSTSLIAAAGMLMMLFGYFSIRQAIGNRTAADAFVRFGVLALTVGLIGFIFNQGLNHMIAHIINHGGARGATTATLISHAIDVQSVKVGIAIYAGYVYLVGLTFFSLGIYLRLASGHLKTLAGLVVLASAAALVVLGIGDHMHNLDFLYRVARYVALVLYLWAIVLGIAMYRGHTSLTKSE